MRGMYNSTGSDRGGSQAWTGSSQQQAGKQTDGGVERNIFTIH